MTTPDTHLRQHLTRAELRRYQDAYETLALHRVIVQRAQAIIRRLDNLAKKRADKFAAINSQDQK